MSIDHTQSYICSTSDAFIYIQVNEKFFELKRDI